MSPDLSIKGCSNPQVLSSLASHRIAFLFSSILTQTPVLLLPLFILFNMKLFTVALLATTATALALPRGSDQSSSSGQMSVKQGQEKCGSQAKLSCCNNQVYNGDAYNKNKGLLEHGILSDLVNGHSQNGLGVFDQCSEITSDSMFSSFFFFFFLSSLFPSSPGRGECLR